MYLDLQLITKNQINKKLNQSNPQVFEDVNLDSAAYTAQFLECFKMCINSHANY